jgi:hypothetical protein
MFRAVSRFVRLSFVSIVATTILSGVAMTPAFAQATKLSKADQRLLKAAIHSCKSEAKAKKIKLLSRRQFVVDCVQALKDRPQVNVQEDWLVDRISAAVIEWRRLGLERTNSVT